MAAQVHRFRALLHQGRETLQCTWKVTMMTNAKVMRMQTKEKGDRVAQVEVERGGEILFFKGDIVVVSCGAINSAVLFQRSANSAHPDGLANASDQVGRNLMKHQ